MSAGHASLLASLVLAACSAPATSGATEAPSDPQESPAAAQSTHGAASAPESAEPEAGPEWRELPTTGPQPREDHTWTLDGSGEVAYLFGGRDRATVHGDLWSFDLATDSWEELTVPAGPAPRFGHEAVWVEGTGLVVFAGQAGSTFFNDLWGYDPEAGAWRELSAGGDVPVARYGTCAAIGPDGRLWISHGFTSENARFHDTVAYDFASGTWTDETPPGPVPVDRCLHGCWWTEAAELALFGGQTTGAVALGDLWRLSDGAWTSVEVRLPAARNLYASARIEPAATLVFGGQAVDETYLGDLFVLADAGGDALGLETVGATPAARAGAAMIADAARGRVLLFGGRDAEQAFGDVWELRGFEAGG